MHLDAVIWEWIFVGIRILAIFVITFAIVPYTVMAERWVCAWIQDRIGPNRTGWFGLMQPWADALKLFLKEDIIPNHVHKVCFVIAPTLVFLPALLTMALMPWGSNLGPMSCVLADIGPGMLVVFALGAFSVYGIVLAGWSSNSKFPFLGGVRSAAQLISYEVCIGLSLVAIFMQTQTLNLTQTVLYQAANGWLVWQQPLAAFLFLICMFAETNRAPFDFPEAEQELVAGYHTEYSSMSFAMFFLAEYINMVTVSAVATDLFLGGWHGPFLPESLGWIWFLVKMGALLFFYVWMRWTLPRYRYDQLMRFGWKVLLPLAVINLLVTAAGVLYSGV